LETSQLKAFSVSIISAKRNIDDAINPRMLMANKLFPTNIRLSLLMLMINSTATIRLLVKMPVDIKPGFKIRTLGAQSIFCSVIIHLFRIL